MLLLFRLLGQICSPHLIINNQKQKCNIYFKNSYFVYIFQEHGKAAKNFHHDRVPKRTYYNGQEQFLFPISKEPFKSRKERSNPMIMDRIALIIAVIGALNWGSIGLFQFDIVAWLGGGSSSLLSRVIYTVVGLAGIWCISLIFRAREAFDRIEE